MKKLLVFFTVVCVVCISCASKPAPAPKSAREQAAENSLPIRTIPAQRPEWVDIVPKANDSVSFVGASNRFATDATARNAAQEDGRRQLVDYYGTAMENKGREFSATHGITSDTFAPEQVGQALNSRIAQNVAQALEARAFYTEIYLDNTNREAYQVHVLMEVSKSIVARVIDNFGKEEADKLRQQAAAEQDANRKQQLEKAAEFFGGNLSSALF